MILRDDSLPHQIRLVFSNDERQCLDGEYAVKAAVVVTCNCHPKGTYMGVAPTTDIAWAVYNNPKYHNHEKKEFQP